MMREVLGQVSGPIYPMVGLLLFGGVFLALMVNLMKKKDGYFERMSKLPLEESKNE